MSLQSEHLFGKSRQIIVLKQHIPALPQTFPTSKYATFGEVVSEFLKQDEMLKLSPKAAAFAVAGAVR